MSAVLQKKRREKLHSKLNDNILKNTVDNLLKKLVFESTTHCLTEDSKKEEAVVPNNFPETPLTTNAIISQKSKKVTPKILQPTILYKTILEKTLVDNKTEPTIDIEINSPDFTDPCASIALKKDTEKENKNPIKNILPNDELVLLHCYKGSSNDTSPQKPIKVTSKKLQPTALYKTNLEETLVDNKTEPTIGIEVNTQDFTDPCASITLKKDIEKEDEIPVKNILSNNELLLLHCCKDITSQKSIKTPPKKLRPTAFYKAILEKTLVDNKIQPTVQIDIVLNTNPDLTKSGSSITLKEEIEEKDKNPINNILPDDELLPFQKVRMFSINNVKQTLDEEICPRCKVFVTDPQKAPRDGQQPQGDGSHSNNSNLSTPSQQSIRDVKETLLILNLRTSKNQKSASVIQRIKCQKPQKQTTVVKSDPLKSILGHQHSPKIERTELDKNKRVKIKKCQSKTRSVGTSNYRSVKLSLNTRSSQTGKVPPELLVLKQPEESGSHDEFIPPVALKNLAKNANIIQIEELSEDSDDKIKETKQKLQQTGEAFETGEWFETATMRSKSDSIIGLPTHLPRHINTNSISSCALCSKRKLPSKESTENYLQASFCSKEAIKALKIKSDQRKSTSSGFVAALDKVKYLDRFDSPDDFDESFQHFLEIKASVDREKSIDNRKIYEYKEEGSF